MLDSSCGRSLDESTSKEKTIFKQKIVKIQKGKVKWLIYKALNYLTAYAPNWFILLNLIKVLLVT